MPAPTTEDKVSEKLENDKPKPAPAADLLAHYVKLRRSTSVVDLVEGAERERRERMLRGQKEEDEIVSLLRDRIDDAVFDELAIREFVRRHGPFVPNKSAGAIDDTVLSTSMDQHTSVYLDAILEAHK